jgi:2-methylcitrate dehydratase PrpD
LSTPEKDVVGFMGRSASLELPPAVVAQAKRCILDLLGVAAGGFGTQQATIVRDHVLAEDGPRSTGSRVFFDGRRLPATSAAWANATMIESLDAHDGHSMTKGHAGVAVLPAVIAALEDAGAVVSGPELLRIVVQGYELAIRAGLALHGTAPDYHSSGAWNSVACALVAAQLFGCASETMLDAAGIAEYWGPRGPMMRCIACPSMVKDSSAWGAKVGVEAALLARRGFTGRPAELINGPVGLGRASVEASRDVAELWSDLGERWRILELYFKPVPVCRWAQPAVEAVLHLTSEHAVAPSEVTGIEVGTFAQAVALDTREVTNTEDAQYSLPYAVAAALRTGSLGANEVSGPILNDDEVVRLSRAVRLREVTDYSDRFPAERLADVVLEMADGTRIELREVSTRGDPSSPLGEDEIARKFRSFCGPLIGEDRTAEIESSVGQLDDGSASAADLVELIVAGPPARSPVASRP